MAASGTITISGSIVGLPTGSKAFNASVTLNAAVGSDIDITLASGDNTIAVPTGATLALIVPPTGNVIALKIKGIAGDTGVFLNKIAPTMLALDPAQASFILNAASLTTGVTEINFA